MMSDRRLRNIVTGFRDGLLAGESSTFKCGMVSYALQGYLYFLGVDTKIVTLNFAEINHVFLQLPDGRIIDATADQFGLPPVYIGPMPLKYATRKARLVHEVE